MSEEKKPITRALRYNGDKLQWSLVDFESIESMVQVLMFGTKKYDRDNWKKGMPYTQICESLLRHIFAFLSGEDNDPESGLSHIGHMQCNTMFLDYAFKQHKEYDDRFEFFKRLEKEMKEAKEKNVE
jgi:hypothetical protein